MILLLKTLQDITPWKRWTQCSDCPVSAGAGRPDLFIEIPLKKTQMQLSYYIVVLAIDY